VTGVTAPAVPAAHADTIKIGRTGDLARNKAKEVSMSKFVIGEQVDNGADDHQSGTVVAVFPTVEGNFRYAVDMEGYGALQFFNEERLVLRLH
jgi:hypothetical protein